MIRRNLTIFRRFALVIFSLITILGGLFIIITYLATTHYHEASTQLLNKDVAQHLAEYSSSFTSSGVNKRKADSVFQNAMILNPSAEVYFLDSAGKVIYFHASEKDIKEWNIPLRPIANYIAAKGELYIKSTDPKDPGHLKIFSAALVPGRVNNRGYIYVILGSKKYESIMDMLFGSHILNLAIEAFIFIILLSALFSILYLRRTRKNYVWFIEVLERFESGDYDARFDIRQQHELEPVTHAFNKMAGLLSLTISKLTKSEGDRKRFIAMISHDLRTPLSIARGYMETLLEKNKTQDLNLHEEEQYSQLIYSKILQIENLVKQLSELSKMDAVEFRPKKEPFVLSEIVQELVNTFKLLAVEKSVSLKCTQCVYHVWINADISLMERVLQNLVDNALKYTPAGGSIQVSIIVENNELIFRIENTGPSMKPEILQWINQTDDEEGWSVDRPQKPGIGLVIVKKILRLHDSSLEAGLSDKGNVFSFRMPIYTLPV